MAVTTSLAQAGNTPEAVYGISQNIRAITEASYRIASGKRYRPDHQDTQTISVAGQLQAQVASFRSALKNNAQATSLLAVAYTGLTQISAILDRLLALAQQASEGGLTDNGRSAIDADFQKQKNDIDTVANTTSFGGITLLDGSIEEEADALIFAAGQATDDTIDVTIRAANTARLFDGVTSNLGTAIAAASAITDVQTAQDLLQQSIRDVQAFQQRFFYAGDHLEHLIGGLDHARSILTDADMPDEKRRQAIALLEQSAGAALLAQSQRLAPHLLQLLH